MKKMLVALDSSPVREVVLEAAIDLARATGAKLRLVHVLPETVHPPVANVFEPAGDTAARIAEASRRLEKTEELIPVELRDGVTTVVGKTWQSIVAEAAASDADLVVIGAHRYSVFERVLGTTASHVVDHVDRPLFVVRPRAAPSSLAAPEHQAPQRVVRPVE